nr:MAG TPA: YspA [Caudoviricetes sp.]
MVKVAVVGIDSFTDYEKLKETVTTYTKSFSNITFIAGCERKFSALVEKLAKELMRPVVIYKADTNRNGKMAKFIRNQTIIDNSEISLIFSNKKSKDILDYTLRADQQYKKYEVFEI